jgi:hypothetical protein
MSILGGVLAAAGLPGAASGEADFLANLDNLVNLSSRAGEGGGRRAGGGGLQGRACLRPCCYSHSSCMEPTSALASEHNAGSWERVWRVPLSFSSTLMLLPLRHPQKHEHTDKARAECHLTV